jgi:hypothetical protein
MKRDWKNVGKRRDCHDKKRRRPIWKGPIPDRYYYAVRNFQVFPMTWQVPFTEDYSVRQVECACGGKWSLIESKNSLPIGNKGKLLAHSKVDLVRMILVNSHIPIDSTNPSLSVKVEFLYPATEEEVFI